MARKATFIATGALSMALIAACPALATAETPSAPEVITGVAGVGLTANEQDAEKKLPAALEGKTDIEKLTIAHDNAAKGLRDAEDRVAEIQVQITELEKVLPAQQARSDAAIRQRYIMQSNPLAIAEPLLSSQSMDEFIRQIDYLQIISKSNLREFNKTRDMKNSLDDAKNEQDRIREEAAAKAEDALEALKEEQDARAKKQEEGQEKAIRQAATGSEKKSAANDDDNSNGNANDSDDKGSSKKTDAEATKTTQETNDLIDGADWHAHRDDFIAEWSRRLDDYLEGTPLEGQGVNFAASAWKYCIDPRWSAAISNTESSKGQFCIRPHNAWGWGAADSDPYNLAAEWGSWEEAIDAHAAGLAKGYGYTISLRGAQSYCPPSWQSWYNKTLAEMAKI